MNGSWYYQTRLFDNYAFTKKLLHRLSLNDLTDVGVVQLLPSNAQKQTARLLVSYGQSDVRRYAVVTATTDQMLNHDFDLEQASYSSSVLNNSHRGTVRDLVTGGSKQVIVASPISQKLMSLMYIDESGRNALLKEEVAPEFRYDSLLEPIAAFTSGNKYYSFLEASTELIAHVGDAGGDSARSKQFQASIRRVSFLPGSVFSEVYFPTRYVTGQTAQAALFADATQITSNNVYVWVLDENSGLIDPLGVNVDVPSGCMSMNAQAMSSGAKDDILLFCKTAVGYEFRALPIQSY